MAKQDEILKQIVSALSQGAKPQQLVQALVSKGLSKDQATQFVQIGIQSTEQPQNVDMPKTMKYGGDHPLKKFQFAGQTTPEVGSFMEQMPMEQMPEIPQTFQESDLFMPESIPSEYAPYAEEIAADNPEELQYAQVAQAKKRVADKMVVGDKVSQKEVADVKSGISEGESYEDYLKKDQDRAGLSQGMSDQKKGFKMPSIPSGGPQSNAEDIVGMIDDKHWRLKLLYGLGQVAGGVGSMKDGGTKSTFDLAKSLFEKPTGELPKAKMGLATPPVSIPTAAATVQNDMTNTMNNAGAGSAGMGTPGVTGDNVNAGGADVNVAGNLSQQGESGGLDVASNTNAVTGEGDVEQGVMTPDIQSNALGQSPDGEPGSKQDVESQAKTDIQAQTYGDNGPEETSSQVGVDASSAGVGDEGGPGGGMGGVEAEEAKIENIVETMETQREEESTKKSDPTDPTAKNELKEDEEKKKAKFKGGSGGGGTGGGGGGNLIAGLDAIGDALAERKRRKKKRSGQAWSAGNTMNKYMGYASEDAYRGDFTTNQGVFKPDKKTPAQDLGTGYFAKEGGQFTEGQEVLMDQETYDKFIQMGGEVEIIQDYTNKKK